MVRVLVISAVFVCLTLPCLAVDTVSIIIGKPETGGLTMLNAGDGQYLDKEIDGRMGRSPRSDSEKPCYYLYFRTSDEFAKEAKEELYFLVEYFDDGFGTFNLHYQSSRGNYEGGPGAVLLGTKQWQIATWQVKGIKLGRSQNNGADFRFAMFGQQPVSRVVVSTKPIPGVPKSADLKERLKAMEKDIVKPQGMEYTFGNDCDETSGALYRRLGVTSIESYVTWQSCEPNKKGDWDWSRWDTQVENLKKTGLKWVPFLILSPAYSTPNWFRESSEHYPCACLEHGTTSKIESLWNPNLPKYIDRFIGEFAKRYRDTGVIESVLLGIQGDFGEAIYSVTGGGWTFDIPGVYHNHGGFWCNDEYALADFRKWAAKKYTSISAVNNVWGTNYGSFDQVDFPARGDEAIKTFRASLPAGNAQDRRKWLDFVQWYRDSMTRWSDEWIAITKKHFPKTPIYLCTGGDAPPEHGSDFAAQCKVAAKHGAGVRITNEGSNYQSNFVMTRWVAASGKLYGAFYGFEPAGHEDENGVIVRIYNATASGANQLHDYTPNITNNPKSLENQQKHLKYLKKREPKVDVALFYPNTHMTISWGGFFDKARMLRDITDYDFMDEGMLRDGALKRYKVLVFLHGDYIEQSDLYLLQQWVEEGGVVAALDLSNVKTIEGKKLTDALAVESIPAKLSAGSGTVYNTGLTWEQRDNFFKQLADILKSAGVAVPDGEADGVFATEMKDGSFLFLNTTDKDAEKSAGSKKVAVTAGTITEVGR